jgi:uncharacterized Zn ribbon protein
MIKGYQRRTTMKCQTDYDTERDALLRQADECMEEWWEEEPKKSEEPARMAREGDVSALIVKTEVRKRGLLAIDEEARV